MTSGRLRQTVQDGGLIPLFSSLAQQRTRFASILAQQRPRFASLPSRSNPGVTMTPLMARTQYLRLDQRVTGYRVTHKPRLDLCFATSDGQRGPCNERARLHASPVGRILSRILVPPLDNAECRAQDEQSQVAWTQGNVPPPSTASFPQRRHGRSHYIFW